MSLEETCPKHRFSLIMEQIFCEDCLMVNEYHAVPDLVDAHRSRYADQCKDPDFCPACRAQPIPCDYPAEECRCDAHPERLTQEQVEDLAGSRLFDTAVDDLMLNLDPVEPQTEEEV